MTETSVSPMGPLAAGMAAPSIAILATQAATLAAAFGATVPSGAATVVGVTDMAVIALALCDPTSFFTEGGQWQQVASYCSSFSDGLQLPMQQFTASWQGPAATSFFDYYSNVLNPVFPKIAALAAAEKSLLDACGYAVLTAAGGFVVLNIPLIITALMLAGLAPATLGTSLAGQWPATLSWAGLITAGVAWEFKLFTDINTKLGEVRTAGESLANYINSSTSRLEGNNLKMPDLELPPVTADINELAGMTTTFGPKDG